MQENIVNDIEAAFSKYGHLDDDTEYLTEEWKDKIGKSYMLYFDAIQSKDSEDISIDIHFCNEGNFIVEKGSLALTAFSSEQVLFIEEKLKDTPFQMKINSHEGYTAVNFTAEANTINEMLQLVTICKNVLHDYILEFGDFHNRKLNYKGE